MPSQPLRHLVEQFVIGALDFPSFATQFTLASWDVALWGSESTQQFVYDVELLMAEVTNGHLDEAGLRDDLRGLVVPPVQQSSATDRLVFDVGAPQGRHVILVTHGVFISWTQSGSRHEAFPTRWASGLGRRAVTQQHQQLTGARSEAAHT